MNVNLMSVKISYSKDVDGKQKKVNENYLVSGWSFGVTEKNIEDFFTKEVYENLIVEDISRTKIEEFVPNEKLEEQIAKNKELEFQLSDLNTVTDKQENKMDGMLSKIQKLLSSPAASSSSPI